MHAETTTLFPQFHDIDYVRVYQKREFQRVILFHAAIAHEQSQFVLDIKSLLTWESPASYKLKEYVGVRFRLLRELVNLNTLRFRTRSEVKSMSGDPFKNVEEQELKAIHHILTLGKRSGEFFGELKKESELFVDILFHALRSHH